MAAHELFRQAEEGFKSAQVWACSECFIIHQRQDLAENCRCHAVCKCGAKPMYSFGTICSECDAKERRAREAAKEQERFAKARKIPEAEYEGDKVFCNDKFYDTVEEAIDNYLDGHEPEYVWACKNIGVRKASSEPIVEHILESMWEDAESSDLNGLDELEAAIDAFNEATKGICVYQPDYSLAILINKKDGSL